MVFRMLIIYATYNTTVIVSLIKYLKTMWDIILEVEY